MDGFTACSILRTSSRLTAEFRPRTFQLKIAILESLAFMLEPEKQLKLPAATFLRQAAYNHENLKIWFLLNTAWQKASKYYFGVGWKLHCMIM